MGRMASETPYSGGNDVESVQYCNFMRYYHGNIEGYGQPR